MTVRSTRLALASLLLAIGAIAACHHSSSHGRVTVGSVGSAGGVVSTLSGVTLSFPAGAVDTNTQITITENDGSAPSALNPLSSLYSFEPAGLVFAHPVTLTLPLPVAAASADIFWSKVGASGYDDLGGTSAAGKVAVQIVHFSKGFLAPAMTTRAVIGSKVTSWVNDAAVRNVSQDLSNSTIQALVYTSGATPTAIVGTGFANGTFSIPNVPYGEFVMQIGSDYFVTTSGCIDLGSSAFGRPDALPITDTMNTFVHLLLSNMQAWGPSGFSYEFYVPAVNNWAFTLEGLYPPPPNATSLDVLITPNDMKATSTSIPHLVEAAKGDVGYATELALSTSMEGVPYNAATRIFESAPFDLTNGTTATLTGAFADVSSANTATFDIRASQFRSLVSQIDPGATSIGSVDVFVEGQPGGLALGPISSAAGLMLMNAGTADVLATNVKWGAPTTGSFGMRVTTTFPVEHLYYLGSSTSTTVRETGSLTRATDVAGSTAAPITPHLTPVQNPTIGGFSLFTNHTGVGLTPVIAWDAPATGTPTRYAVRITQLTAPGTLTYGTLVAEFLTSKTSVQVPPGMFATGNTYIVRITASDPAVAISAPSRGAYPMSSADVLSGMFQP